MSQLSRLNEMLEAKRRLDNAAWQVHLITARTDQSLDDIVRLYPEHHAVTQWREAQDVLRELVRGNQS